MDCVLDAIGKRFRLPGNFYAYQAMSQGNINSTYKVSFRHDDGSTKPYIFQRVNTFVFKNPADIMENIELVTGHIRAKQPEKKALHFHHTDEGKNYLYDDDKHFWRVMNFIDGVTCDLSDDLEYITQVGKAFGQFQDQLSDFDGSRLHETIPDFHNTRRRLDTLFAHAEADPIKRAGDASLELAYLRAYADSAAALSDRYNRGELPQRVTHNDTKANNVILDRRTKEPIAVIDLDTVMPGMPMYDFADAVRFICNTSVEDEPDTSVVFFDTAKFKAFAQGFLPQVKASLTPAEIEAMAPAVFSITVELASRFLDDYLTGDLYFKTNYPGHNLVRTRCQLKLAQDIWQKKDELNWIVREACKD